MSIQKRLKIHAAIVFCSFGVMGLAVLGVPNGADLPAWRSAIIFGAFIASVLSLVFIDPGGPTHDDL